MKVFVLKPLKIILFPFALTVSVAGCGGSSGSTPIDPFYFPDYSDVGNTHTDTRVQQLTADNYVASASAFYLLSQTLTGASAIGDIWALGIIMLTPEGGISEKNDCKISGAKTVSIGRSLVPGVSVHLRDSIENVYDNCNEAGSIQAGTSSMVVERMNGDFISGNYNVSMVKRDDYRLSGSINPEDDGVYRTLSDSTLISRKDGDEFLYGVNISRLNASLAPDEKHTFYTEVDHFPILVNAPEYDTPTHSFDPYAFEMVSHAGDDDGLLSFRWDYGAVDKISPKMSYTAKTLQQVKLKQEERVNAEGEEYTVYNPLQGKFRFWMISGEVVTVSFNGPAARAPGVNQSPEVLATLDIDGDGVMEASKKLSYAQFVTEFVRW